MYVIYICDMAVMFTSIELQQAPTPPNAFQRLSTAFLTHSAMAGGEGGSQPPCRFDTAACKYILLCTVCSLGVCIETASCEAPGRFWCRECIGGGRGGPASLGACRSNTADSQTEAYCSTAHTRPKGHLRRACGRNGSLNLVIPGS
jgi:hypothetical protein